jgi:hypothetical protein
VYSADKAKGKRSYWIVTKIRGDFQRVGYQVDEQKTCARALVIIGKPHTSRFYHVAKPGLWYHPNENTRYTEYYSEPERYTLVDEMIKFQRKDVELFTAAVKTKQIKNPGQSVELISLNGEHLLIYTPPNTDMNRVACIEHYAKCNKNDTLCTIL